MLWQCLFKKLCFFAPIMPKIMLAHPPRPNSIYFCRKYTIFTKFYEFMLQKVLKSANYAVAVLV